MRVVDCAEDLARRVHEGDMYGGLSYADGHLVLVVEGVKFFWGRRDLVVAAWLHDSVEDHPDLITVEDIAFSFGDSAARIVDVLTRREGVSYFDYVENVLEAGVGPSLVKFCDVSANLRSCYKDLLLGKGNERTLSRVGRYDKALVMLRDGLFV